MPNGKKNKSTEAILAEKLAAGTQKHFSNVSSLMFGDGTFTPVQVETQLKALATLRNDVDAAKAAVKAKLADEKSEGPALRELMLAFVAFVKATFPNSPDILADFGLTPKKARKPLTSDELAAAKAKRKATREARGTKGKRQLARIKGDVVGVTVTPVTAAAPPEPVTPPAK